MTHLSRGKGMPKTLFMFGRHTSLTKVLEWRRCPRASGSRDRLRFVESAVRCLPEEENLCCFQRISRRARSSNDHFGFAHDRFSFAVSHSKANDFQFPVFLQSGVTSTATCASLIQNPRLSTCRNRSHSGLASHYLLCRPRWRCTIQILASHQPVSSLPHRGD